MNDKTKPARPADIRGISDPPDMGRLRPAEEVAASLVSAEPVYGRHALSLGPVGARRVLASRVGADSIGEDAAFLRQGLANLIRQSRAEGAAAALEEMAARLEAKASGYSASASDAWAHEASSERYGGKFEAYDDAATILRARIKHISDPPDMG